MVVFVDLESDDDESASAQGQLTSLRLGGHFPRSTLDQESSACSGTRDTTSKSAKDTGASAFAAALTCYPIALSLSSHLDLTDLHALSLTCHSIHTSLTQYASQLIAKSLRCTFDSLPLLSDLLHTQLSGAVGGEPMIDGDTSRAATGRASACYAFSTKIRACALDLVAECRQCGIVVCRNCTAKPPSDRYLRERHRRLCQKCLRAPLIEHLQPLKPVQDPAIHDTPPVSSASSTRSSRSVSNSSTATEDLDQSPGIDVQSSQIMFRGPCVCPTRGVYLCTACGHKLRANDTTYSRVWTWRSRYSTHIGGGIGTGLGLGDQGQKCGRGDQCLESGPESVSWVEIDCSEGDEHDGMGLSRSATPLGEHPNSANSSNRPGYFQQEIEGIGGVVKKKVRKKVRVGATVYEYDDERRTGKYLEREASGRQRSWCGWCGRVCLGEKDRHATLQHLYGGD